MRILLVEDSVALADQLVPLLKEHGYAVDWLADGRDAVVRVHDDPFDLVVLDLGLPGMDGLQVLKQWRQEGLSIPVLILTARDSWSERIEGLRQGADDYLTKPFHPDELLLRIQALLRRSHGNANDERLSAGMLKLDESRQTVWHGEEEIALTGAEFRMLRYFMHNPGRLLSKGQLASHLYDNESDRDSNVLEVHVNHLRRKLGKAVIETRRGQGYVYTGQLS
ncbi:MAG: response regulator transcription factor [Pseudomonadales bacterium]|nr:response regulator transcription factor [Pseudomonadales bacterium]